MGNPKSLSELLIKGGKRLSVLKVQATERSAILEQVRATLPANLAQRVMTAGLADGELSLGVSTAAWATRIRYSADKILGEIGKHSPVTRIRVRVQPAQRT
jgi:hypothetical protein